MTAPTPGFQWTDERKQELIDCVNAGYSAGHIGKLFGVTRSAVCGKVNRMGMRLGGEKRNPVNGKHVHILELRPGHCRWPMWSDKERSSQQYCGHQSIDGSPYCETHFQKSRARPA